VPTIKLLKRAELELIDACEWYEKQQKGLSAKLRAEVKDTLISSIQTPNFTPKSTKPTSSSHP